MREFQDLKIAVAGTGYVGLSIATLLAQHHHVEAVLARQRSSPKAISITLSRLSRRWKPELSPSSSAVPSPTPGTY